MDRFHLAGQRDAMHGRNFMQHDSQLSEPHKVGGVLIATKDCLLLHTLDFHGGFLLAHKTGGLWGAVYCGRWLLLILKLSRSSMHI